MITHMQVNVKKLHENAVLPTYGSTKLPVPIVRMYRCTTYDCTT